MIFEKPWLLPHHPQGHPQSLLSLPCLNPRCSSRTGRPGFLPCAELWVLALTVSWGWPLWPFRLLHQLDPLSTALSRAGTTGQMPQVSINKTEQHDGHHLLSPVPLQETPHL